MSWQILQGDARARLAEIEDESFHMCATSPPYWNLRDYGHAEQIGMEKTPAEYIAHLVEVFAGVHRVLRPDGVLWLNIAPTWASCIIESEDYIIKEDLTEEEYSNVIDSLLPAMRQPHAPTERHVPKVLDEPFEKTGELGKGSLQEMRQKVHDAQVSCGEGAGQILLSEVRPIGQPNKEENLPDSLLRDLLEDVRQVSVERQEKQGRAALLQQAVLVQSQPEGQPPSLVGGPNERMCREGAEWRKAVLKRDHFVCRLCHASKRLEAHHIYPFRTFPAIRWEVSNGVTLCRPCHVRFQSKEMEYVQQLSFIASVPIVELTGCE